MIDDMIKHAPPWASARYAFRGIQVALTLGILLVGMVACSVQTVRLEGAQVKLPLIGTVGPQGWIPYAEELEGQVVRVKLERDEANDNHRKTKANFRAAQAEAERLQREENARIEAQHRRTLNAATTRLRAERDTFRNRYERMRDHFIARADAGSDGEAVRVPLDRDSGEPVEAASCYGVSGRRPYLVQIKCDQIASEQASQLKALQDAVRSAPGVVIVDDES